MDQGLRRKRLKLVFEGRKAQLEALRESGKWPYTTAHVHAYGKAVTKYTRARIRWRRIRGDN